MNLQYICPNWICNVADIFHDSHVVHQNHKSSRGHPFQLTEYLYTPTANLLIICLVCKKKSAFPMFWCYLIWAVPLSQESLNQLLSVCYLCYPADKPLSARRGTGNWWCTFRNAGHHSWAMYLQPIIQGEILRIEKLLLIHYYNSSQLHSHCF